MKVWHLVCDCIAFTHRQNNIVECVFVFRLLACHFFLTSFFTRVAVCARFFFSSVHKSVDLLNSCASRCFNIPFFWTGCYFNRFSDVFEPLCYLVGVVVPLFSNRLFGHVRIAFAGPRCQNHSLFFAHSIRLTFKCFVLMNVESIFNTVPFILSSIHLSFKHQEIAL